MDTTFNPDRPLKSRECDLTRKIVVRTKNGQHQGTFSLFLFFFFSFFFFLFFFHSFLEETRLDDPWDRLWWASNSALPEKQATVPRVPKVWECMLTLFSKIFWTLHTWLHLIFFELYSKKRYQGKKVIVGLVAIFKNSFLRFYFKNWIFLRIYFNYYFLFCGDYF